VSDVSTLPLAPKNPLPLRDLVKLLRRLDTGQETIRDAGGPITRIQFGPKKLFRPIVAVFSPNAMRDVLGRTDAFSERCIIHNEVRDIAGDSLFVLPNEQWRPSKRALQPVFTKHNVRAFGGHMSGAAQKFVDRWLDGAEIDLDVECRKVAMASVGRSILGVDLNERADTIDRCMHVASSYTADRSLRPVRRRDGSRPRPGAGPARRSRRCVRSPTRWSPPAAPTRTATRPWCWR
jgi:cytochrome P450